jgi:hypothetical protein
LVAPTVELAAVKPPIPDELLLAAKPLELETLLELLELVAMNEPVVEVVTPTPTEAGAPGPTMMQGSLTVAPPAPPTPVPVLATLEVSTVVWMRPPVPVAVVVAPPAPTASVPQTLPEPLVHADAARARAVPPTTAAISSQKRRRPRVGKLGRIRFSRWSVHGPFTSA